VITLSIAGVPPRNASKLRLSAGRRSPGASTRSPRAAAGLDHLLEIGRGIELGDRHHVGLGGGALREDVEGGRAHRAPHVIVGHDGQRRQVLGAGHEVVGTGLPNM